MATFEKDCCVRGYRVYQRVWDAAIGENLICRREPTNESELGLCGLRVRWPVMEYR